MNKHGVHDVFTQPPDLSSGRLHYMNERCETSGFISLFLCVTVFDIDVVKKQKQKSRQKSVKKFDKFFFVYIIISSN